jgi:phosphate transport system substrate-binding protein
VIVLALACAVAAPAAGQQLFGSGSTFVYPIMAKWSQTYQDANKVQIAYQPIGSSGGLTEIRAGVVDFGISDEPLDGYQLLRDGLLQFPLVIGAIVPVVNLEGVSAGELHFTGELLASIYLGKVKNWSDPAIAAVMGWSGIVPATFRCQIQQAFRLPPRISIGPRNATSTFRSPTPRG